MNDAGLGRDHLGNLIVDTAKAHADGYRRSVNQFDDEEKVRQAEACACAASNTGWFILKALGYSDDEIRMLTH